MAVLNQIADDIVEAKSKLVTTDQTAKGARDLFGTAQTNVRAAAQTLSGSAAPGPKTVQLPDFELYEISMHEGTTTLRRVKIDPQVRALIKTYARSAK